MRNSEGVMNRTISRSLQILEAYVQGESLKDVGARMGYTAGTATTMANTARIKLLSYAPDVVKVYSQTERGRLSSLTLRQCRAMPEPWLFLIKVYRSKFTDKTD